VSHVFIIGATGYIGRHLARHFVACGHRVSGLARSENAAAELAADGIAPVLGDVDEQLDYVVAAMLAADATIYAAQIAFDREPAVLRALCDALAGSSKTFVFLSGTGVFLQRTAGAWSPDVFAEDDPFTPEPLAIARVEAEGVVRAPIGNGLRGIVVRPPVIWGPDDDGPVAKTYHSVAAVGAACYVGAGLAAYSNVHSADLGRLFERVLERGQAGALCHAVGGEIPYRWSAEAVARDLGVPTRSLSMDEAADVFGPFSALLLSACSRTRDPRTRAELGWEPQHPDMLDQIGEARLRALATQPQGKIA